MMIYTHMLSCCQHSILCCQWFPSAYDSITFGSSSLFTFLRDGGSDADDAGAEAAEVDGASAGGGAAAAANSDSDVDDLMGDCAHEDSAFTEISVEGLSV
jgi:hypothetical protein